MDHLKARMEALRARTPRATMEPSRFADVPRRVQTDDDEDDAPPPGYTRIPSDPPSPLNDDEAHEHIERALDHLERMSSSVPGVKRVLELIERGADGRVTTTSFARAAQALQTVSNAVTRGATAPSPPPPLRVHAHGATSFGSAAKSPRIASPRELRRRSSSPIGPARRVRVDSDGTDVDAPSTVSPSVPSPSAPPAARSFAHEETRADEAGARLREWSEHVRQSKRATDAHDVAHRCREDLISQWRAFLVSNAAPSDPFIAALAEQWMNEARDKETMVRGVARARQMIEALAESDKIKTRTIAVLSEALELAGVEIPRLSESGIEWSEEALHSDEGVFPDDDGVDARRAAA